MELADLLSNFESLGDNCEFGFIQRAAETKGRGLFQWGGMPPANLIHALHTRFHGFDDPANFKTMFHGTEYIIYLKGCNFRVHTGSYKPIDKEENVVREVAIRMRYLVKKLIQELEEGAKIFVFRQNEPLDLGTLEELRTAIAFYGPNTLLWVAEDFDRPEGTITWLGDGLMKGSLTRLSSRASVSATSPHGWHKVLWNAHAERCHGSHEIYLARTLSTFELGRLILQTSFLIEQPEGVRLLSGWGTIETHQTWAGPECAMSLEIALPNSDLLVQVDGFPFANQAGRGPRLTIAVNGIQVKKYSVIPKHCFNFVIPRKIAARSALLKIFFPARLLR